MDAEQRKSLAEIPTALQNVVDQGDLSGFVTLIWHKGEILQRDLVGRRDIAKSLPMTRDTLFRIASMTKPVTALATLMLMEEGRLNLSDPIAKWAPEFSDLQVLKHPQGSLDETYPAPRLITIEDLLTHRAGLAYAFSGTGPIAEAYERVLGNPMSVKISPDEWLKRFSSLPLVYAPGERMHYSLSFDVLGLLLTRIAGKPFREFLMERLFEPLGMTDTDFWCPPEKRGRLAQAYRRAEDESLEPITFRSFETPPEFCGGGGGLISTVDDYLQFAKMLLNKGELNGHRYAKAETIELMTRNHLTAQQRTYPFMGTIPLWDAMGYGLGVSVVMEPEKLGFVGKGGKGSFGWSGSFGTWWQADPENDLILIYLIQNAVPLGAGAVTQMSDAKTLRARIALPMFQNMVYGALGK